jgi:chromosome segregation ATPase
MDKNNARGRYSRDGVGTIVTEDRETRAPRTSADTAGAPSDTAVTSSADARARLELKYTAPTRETPALARGLQDAFLDERNDVLAVINELEDQLDRRQEVQESLERQLSSTTEQLHAAGQRVQELEWHAVTLQTRTDELEHLRQEVAAVEEALNDERARGQRVNEQLAAAEKDRSRLQAELKTSQKQLDDSWTIRKERDGLRTDYKTLSAKVEELERLQREAVVERAALHADLQEARGTLEQLTGERNQLVISQRAAEDRIRELTQVQATLEEKIEALRAEKKSGQAQITHLERENARLVDQRQFFECEVTALRNQNRSAEAALTSIKRAFGEVRVALTETRARTQRRSLDTWPRIGSTLRTGAPHEVPANSPPLAPDSEVGTAQPELI